MILFIILNFTRGSDLLLDASAQRYADFLTCQQLSSLAQASSDFSKETQWNVDKNRRRDRRKKALAYMVRDNIIFKENPVPFDGCRFILSGHNINSELQLLLQKIPHNFGLVFYRQGEHEYEKVVLDVDQEFQLQIDFGNIVELGYGNDLYVNMCTSE